MSNGRSARRPLSILAVVLAIVALALPAAQGLRDGSVGAAGNGLTVSIGSASVVVSAQRQVAIVFPVTLSRPSTQPVTVRYKTHDGTAKSGTSYRAISGTITFSVDPATGTTPITQFAGVRIYPSAYPGGGGKFSMTLSKATGASIGNAFGVGTLLGRGAGSSVRVSAGDMSVYAGARGDRRIGLVLVTLSRPAPKPITLHYAISGGSAIAGAHFLAPGTGTVHIRVGGRETWIAARLVSGSVRGASRSLSIRLTKATGATIVRATGTVTIVADKTMTLRQPWWLHGRKTPKPVPQPASAPPPTTAPSPHPSNAPPPTTAPTRTTTPPVTTPPSKTSTVPKTTPPGQTSVPDPGSPPPPAGLIFDDEFNGSALDLSKWQPNWLGNNNSTITKPINGSELSCYDPAQVAVPGDGYLHLTGVARQCRANDGVTYNYASGLVESKPHFTFTYGYLEARMWLPASASRTANWPAFWADGTGTWPSTGELDVMEGLHGSDCYHFHSPSGGPGSCAPLANPSGWHTFGARWEPGKVTFFYDGANVGQITSGITGAPMYPIVNLALGGEGGAVVQPSTVLVDYVRISQ